jgi:hypothetical protein
MTLKLIKFSDEVYGVVKSHDPDFDLLEVVSLVARVSMRQAIKTLVQYGVSLEEAEMALQALYTTHDNVAEFGALRGTFIYSEYVDLRVRGVA